MIISGGARSYWRDFAAHLMKTEENQSVRIADIRGLAADTVLEAFREMDAMGRGTRAKRFYYHANINPREDESLTPEQWDKAIDALETALGLEGQSRFIVEHEKHGRTHRHVIWSRVDPDTMTVIPDGWNYLVHQRTADALEKEFGHESTPRGRGPDGPNPDNREVYRGKLSGVDTRDVKAELLCLWRQADSGPAFAAALADRGYILAKGDRRDFVVVDPAGNEHSLGRRVNAKASEVRDRMAAVDREILPSVGEARALARQRRNTSEAHDNITEPEAPAAEPVQEKDYSLAQGPEPPVPRSEFDRFAAKMKEALRAGRGEPSAAAGSRWLAERAKTPPARPESSPFGRFAEQMKDAMRAGGGIPATGDGLTFWQRAVAVLSAVGEQAASWALRVYRDVSDRLFPRSPDDPGMER